MSAGVLSVSEESPIAVLQNFRSRKQMEADAAQTEDMFT
jgi:hypothetical protein